MTPDSTISPSALSLDHPGWLTDHRGRARRALHIGGVVWTICNLTNAAFDPVIKVAQPGIVTTHPVAD